MFNDQNSQPLEIGDKIDLTLVVNWCKYITNYNGMRYPIEVRERRYLKG